MLKECCGGVLIAGDQVNPLMSKRAADRVSWVYWVYPVGGVCQTETALGETTGFLEDCAEENMSL